MELLTDPQAWIALATLTVLEIVLGIDNVVFISILVGDLPPRRQPAARITGLSLAMLMRVALLCSITAIMGLTAPITVVLGNEISWRDAILLAGGVFLIVKSVWEIHERLEGPGERAMRPPAASFAGVVAQIVVLDLVFSLDSVITAIAMANRLAIMIVAVVLGIAFMMAFSGGIAAYLDRHPTMKMLALCFLVFIGVALVADGLGQHIPRGYIYFSMAFAIAVELLNIKSRRRRPEPVRLRRQARTAQTKATIDRRTEVS
jgi:predicted tellurium resistance membrane protein TerC